MRECVGTSSRAFLHFVILSVIFTLSLNPVNDSSVMPVMDVDHMESIGLTLYHKVKGTLPHLTAP